MITNNPTITGINGRISLTNDAIAAEVSRATGEEGRIEASIAVTAGEVAIQVVEDNAYLIQSGIDIIPAGIEISGGKYVKIKTGGLFTAESGNFNIDANGNVSMTGSITSTSGSIAGWQINPTTLTGNKTGLAKTTNDADIAIWAGNTTASSAPFRVTQGGKLYASGAVISGDSTFEGTLSANCINGGSIDASDVNITNLNASNITTGSMSAGFITSGTMSANRISGGSIDASDVTITNLNASNITSGSMSASLITSGTMSANRISGGSIDATDVTITNLNASNIASGTMSANRISGGTIDATDVTITNLNASNITSGTMSASKINGGTLTLGGAGNADGVLIVKNAAGTEIGRWDNNGISASAGTFSGNVSGATITGGSLNIGDGNCIIDSGGNVTLKSLNIATEEGGTTTVNLTGYPMWKLYYASIKSVTVEDGYCTQMLFTNSISGVSSVNFKHATAVTGSWSGNIYTATDGMSEDSVEVLARCSGANTSNFSAEVCSSGESGLTVRDSIRCDLVLVNKTKRTASVKVTAKNPNGDADVASISLSEVYDAGSGSVTLTGSWSGASYSAVASNSANVGTTVSVGAGSPGGTHGVQIKPTFDSSHIGKAYVQATLSSGGVAYPVLFTVDASDEYSAGVSAGGVAAGVTANATTHTVNRSTSSTTKSLLISLDTGSVNASGSRSITVKAGDTTMRTATLTDYSDGYTSAKVKKSWSGATATFSKATTGSNSYSVTVGATAGISYNTSAHTYTASAQASCDGANRASDTKNSGTEAYDAGVSAGTTTGYNNAKIAKSWSGGTVTLSKSTSGSNSVSLTVGASAGINYNSSAHTYTASAQASCDGANRASDSSTSGTEAYDAGVTAGAASVTVTDLSLWDGDTQLSGDVSIGVGGSKTIQAWCKRAGTWMSGASITVRGPYLPDTGTWSYDTYQGKFQPKVTILGKTYYSTYLYTGLAT